MSLCLALRRRRPGDEGFALVTVLGSMAVLTLFLVGALAYAVNNLAPTKKDQDAKAALAAAQAGIEDYLTRLNVNNNYWQNNNVDSANAAFGAGLPIAGTGGTKGAFTYKVISSLADVAATGNLRLQVTGTTGTARRTLVATMQPFSFLKYVYYTDFEAVDPEVYARPVPITVGASTWPATVGGASYRMQGSTEYDYYADYATLAAMCSRHYYEGRTTDVTYTATQSSPYYELNVKSGLMSLPITNGQTVTLGNLNAPRPSSTGTRSPCKNIVWTSDDVVNGPLHTNDALQVTGAVTWQNTVNDAPAVESAWPDSATPAPAPDHRWWGSASPSPSSKLPALADRVDLPDSNTSLLASAQANGCVYTGATKITYSGSSVTVFSPNTTSVNKPSCLNVANRANPQTLPTIPSVIYVSPASTSTCAGVGYPLTLNGRTESTLGSTPDHSCGNGTAYVSGQLTGRTTLGADSDIVVTGDLTYTGTSQTSGTNVLGLIANNYVWVYHPVDSSGNNLLPGTSEVHKISAAILSVRHSFLVQSWDYGAPLNYNGLKLSVTGSISQRFRGSVGTSSSGTTVTGYAKDYVYDARLRNIPPPYFLAPKQAPWTVNEVSG